MFRQMMITLKSDAAIPPDLIALKPEGSVVINGKLFHFDGALTLKADDGQTLNGKMQDGTIVFDMYLPVNCSVETQSVLIHNVAEEVKSGSKTPFIAALEEIE